MIKESSPFDTFIPEDLNEEQQMVKDMCSAFLEAEVLPVLDRIDKLEPGLMPSLVAKAGEQGLLGAAVPEDLGGLGKDFITSTLVNEGLGVGFSFSVAKCAHRYRHPADPLFRYARTEKEIYSQAGQRAVEGLLWSHGTQ